MKKCKCGNEKYGDYQECFQCKRFKENKLTTVKHNKLVRCPKCGQSYPPFTITPLIQGVMTMSCPCGFNFQIKQQITYISPAMEN